MFISGAGDYAGPDALVASHQTTPNRSVTIGRVSQSLPERVILWNRLLITKARARAPVACAWKSMTESILNSERVAVTTRKIRAGNNSDVKLVHGIYQKAPEYFEQISMPVPSVAEIETDISIAIVDERRTVELVLVDWNVPGVPTDPVTGQTVVGYLDYTLDYPNEGDATVNLLLIRSDLQSRGIGRACARVLEQRLAGQARRLLASIYGSNPRARQFWQRLGYHFAIDARPMVEWYGKELRARATVGV